MDRSQDWLNQAIYDLAAAKNLLNSGDHAWSCFLSQQTAEKSLIAIGEKFNIIIWGHDLVDILKELRKSIEIPHLIELYCKTLNLYYISTRYPDAFSSGVPSEKFSKEQAQEAIKFASEVMTFARNRL